MLLLTVVLTNFAIVAPLSYYFARRLLRSDLPTTDLDKECEARISTLSDCEQELRSEMEFAYTAPMHTFETHIQKVATDALRSLKPDAADIYAVSFYVDAAEDDLRQIELNISHNTEGHFESSVEEASDAAEARWNYAFWSQEPDAIVAGVDDEEGQALREQWLNDLGVNYTDEEEDEDFDAVMKLCEKIEAEFFAMAARVAKRLHETGVVTRTFGRAIPILVHELEYDDTTVALTESANPPGVADEFVAWVNSL